MKVPYLQLWSEIHGEAHTIPHDISDYPNLRSSVFSVTIICIHSTTRGAHICFQTIVLYAFSFYEWLNNTLGVSYFYTTFCGETNHIRVRVSLTSTTVPSGHGIILMLSANVGMKSAAASAFAVVSSEILSWVIICYLTD
jgi:hypothetical protein